MTVWDVLIGQDEAIDTLVAAARAGQAIATRQDAKAGALTHAWLFTGPPGSGRSVAARALAAALQCTAATVPTSSEGGDRDVVGADIDDGPATFVAEPGCGECQGCHTTLAGTHPDVKVINPEGLSIGVEAMRTVVANSARRPALGRWQVIIIEDSDRLTEGASNALLKAIEEPPPRTVFLLCAPSTHPDDVSVTIRSRCRGVTLRTPSAAAIAGVLRADGYDEISVQWISQAAQGHVGRARRLARDEQARARRASVLAIPAALDSMQACFDAADALLVAADQEADAAFVGRDVAETEALKIALGAGGTGRGALAAGRGAAGQVKELERRQKSRATRTKRDVLDRALVDLAGFYRDVLMVQLATDVPGANPDVAASVAQVAARLTRPQTLERLDAVLQCREALDLNVKPRIAVEAMTFALRLPY